MSYVLPQVQVFQDFRALPTEVIENLNAFVFGPHYKLMRYAEADEKALTALGAYDKTTETVYAYPNQPAGSTVDVDYVKLFADDVWLKYYNVPESAVNPLVAVSATELNKLRAAPRIVDGGNAFSGTVTYAVGGYHVGTIALPEVYYITPQATFNLGTEAGVMDYVTTEDVEGTFDVEDDATTAGVVTEGPDGIAFDFDNPDSVKSPLVVTISDGGANSFDLAILAGALKTHAEAAVVAAPIQVNVIATGVTSWVSPLLTVALDEGDGSLNNVRQAIIDLGTDVTTLFDVGAVSGSDAAAASAAVDQDAVNVLAATVDTVTDVIKIVAYENTTVFKTENGFSRSPALYKDVQIGDKVVAYVTPSETGTPVEIETTVVGLEADYQRASAAAPVAGEDNQATLTGDDLSPAVESLVAPGPDNQVTDDFDYDGGGCTVGVLTGDYRFEDLTNGILSDTITLTVTKAGLKGVAQVSVTNAQGTFLRTGVPVEDVGGNAGQVYVGDGVYVDFVAGAGNPTGQFLLGDSYVVGPLESAFTAIEVPALAGSYGGPVDTTYTVQVTRGGKFDRSVAAYEGLTATADAVLNPSIASWTGGDVDDEYILECVTGGDLITSTFKLTSRRGDNMSGITFPGFGSGNAVTVGASGLSLYMTTGATPTFAAGDYFVIRVNGSRPKVQITDSSGTDQESAVVVNDGVATALGLYGLTITFPSNANGGLTKGDKFTVVCTASAPGAVQTLVLSDALPADVTGGADVDGNVNLTPDLFSIDLLLKQNSTEIPNENRDPLVAPGDFNWAATVNDLTVSDGIKLQDSRIVDGLGEQPYLEVYEATLYAEYRALLSTYAGSITSINDISEIDALGENSADNPLRLGVQAALENSDGADVYFIAVGSDDEDGWLSVLSKASVTDKVYAFAPMTQDASLQALIQAHVDSMSTETAKRWRRSFLGRDLPSVAGVVTSAIHPMGNNYKATVTDDTRVAGTQYTRVEFDEDAQLLSRVQVGDTVRLQFSTDAWGNSAYVTDTVAEVDSNTVLYLSGGLGSEINTAQRTEVWHTYSVAEIATQVAAISTAFGDQRVCHVFPGQLGRSGEYVDAMFGAAAIAGLVSAVAPQQGLTNVELVGFDDVPLTYGTFSQTQLNEMAAEGTLIIMQETQGGEIFIRHQLTTAAGDGDLTTSELSMVKNLDSISYYFANRLRPYIGRYNVTDELISVLRTVIQDGINYLGSLTDIGLLGPQVDLETTNIRTVEQHPTLRDRVLAIVEVGLPAPMNVIELHLVV